MGRKFVISDGGMIKWGLIVVIQAPSRDHMRFLLLQGFTSLFSFSSLLVL